LEGAGPGAIPAIDLWSGSRRRDKRVIHGLAIMGKVQIPKEDDELPTDQADKRRDDALRNTLKMPPKKHEDMKIGDAAKGRRERPSK